MEWFKWFGGSSNDPKFHVVARKTNQPMGFVIAVWAMLLERASEADERGNIAGFDCEAADVVMGMPDGAACAIVEAMQAKGLIDADRICRWEERQAPADRPAKPTSTLRVQRFREKQRTKIERGETSSDTDETHETHGNVSARFETDETSSDTDETHETGKDKIREDKNIKTPSHESLSKYQDARVAQTVPEGGEGEEYLEPARVDENTPSLEFQELRLYYNAHGRQEAPKTGWQEYLALHASRQWPGQSAIYTAIDRLSQHDGPWLAGKAPGLAKFFREQWWRMQPRPNPRASPLAAPGRNSLAQRNAAVSMQVLAELEAEKNEN